MTTVLSDAPAAAPGLTSAEAERRLRDDGPNRIPAPRPPSAVVQLLRQMVHFFALMLWAAAVLALIAGTPALAVAIVAVVVLNGIFAFAQEHRADRAAARLADLLPARARVRRDDVPQVIDAADLVLGDRVLLAAGDRVSADLQLTTASSFGVDESMLTGESVVVRADAGDPVFAGTFVVEGEAEADVVAVAANTRLADIAAQTRSAERPRSPLTMQLRTVVRAVAGIALVVGGVFFVVALATGVGVGTGLVLAVGVTVALVPEGLLPTVTLSLAHAAQAMAKRHALVRRLEAVETLGSTTFICSDKTGTLTRNEMAVVGVWTPVGVVDVAGSGYDPAGELSGDPSAISAVRALAESAVQCSTGRTVRDEAGRWLPAGDPMEVALHVLALRSGVDVTRLELQPVTSRFPFDPRRRRESVVAAGVLHLKGAPDSVLPRCLDHDDVTSVVDAFAERGLRVLAVARRLSPPATALCAVDLAERDLELLGLVALQDPPRDGVGEAIARCRQAGVRIALVTGDHPATARAIARDVGILTSESTFVTGADLPAGDIELGRLLDHDGTVVARVTPEDKLRIARALQCRGHVVAMTGDGVNDGPALRQADIGVAMGRSGTDVAREAADLVLLDDSFPTIVSAIELGRTTTANIRRFLTYHLTDNVAELAPFAFFALSGGAIPLALTVLMVLALDIGTDLLPALALGAEPPDQEVLSGSPGDVHLVDATLLRRAFLVLGPVEAAVEMAVFAAVLLTHGWRWGDSPSTGLLLSASGAAFATVVLGQLANAFACRSDYRPVWRMSARSNPLLLWAVGFELVALGVFLWVPALSTQLELRPPTTFGWALAALAVPAVVLADATQKALRRRHRDESSREGHAASM